MFKKKKPKLKTLEKQFAIKNDTKIYKYLSFDKFLHLIEKNILSLAQASKYWEDPYEGILVDSKIQGCINFLKENENISLNQEVLKKNIDILNNGLPKNSMESAERLIVSQLYQKTLVHGTSWSLNPESDAMWRIYSPNKHGIQIQTTAGKLKRTLRNVKTPQSWIETFYTVGRVNYSLPTKTHIYIDEDFLFKGSAFCHEQEARGIVLPIHPHRGYTLTPKSVDILYAKLVEDFIETVNVDPRAEDWFFDAVKSYCSKENILSCKKSNLYSKPKFTF